MTELSMRTGNENMQWKIISEAELCVFVFCMGGWTTVFAHGKISGSGCGWKTATLKHPLLDLVGTHSCSIWITYITTHTHTHTQTVQKQPVRKEGSRGSGRGERGRARKGGVGRSKHRVVPRLYVVRWHSYGLRRSCHFRGKRESQALADVHTHMCVTPVSGVCHKCIIVCYFTAAAEVLWLLLKSLWAAWSAAFF